MTLLLRGLTFKIEVIWVPGAFYTDILSGNFRLYTFEKYKSAISCANLVQISNHDIAENFLQHQTSPQLKHCDLWIFPQYEKQSDSRVSPWLKNRRIQNANLRSTNWTTVILEDIPPQRNYRSFCWWSCVTQCGRIGNSLVDSLTCTCKPETSV